VSGSVREASDKLRVTVQLSNTDNGQLLWSDHFEGHSNAVFEIQDRIVQSIVGALAVKLTQLEQKHAWAKPRTNAEAYDLVLRARELVVRGDRVANREARELLVKASEIAPDYAMAYVVMAEAEYQRAIYGWVEDAAESLNLARQWALHALTIDDPGANARAHGQLAVIDAMSGNIDHALAEADQAIAMNPSDAFAFDTRGNILMWLGRFAEAIVSLNAALRLDPAMRSSETGFSLALALYSSGRYDEALTTADATLARYPDVPFIHALRAATLAQMGSLEEAHVEADRVRQLDPFIPIHDFGSRFVNSKDMAHLQQGLKKAGF